MKAGDVHNMRESLKEYCVRYDRRELLAQWHPKKWSVESEGRSARQSSIRLVEMQRGA